MPQLITWTYHRDVPRDEWNKLDYPAKFAVMEEVAAEGQVKIAESALRDDGHRGKVAGARCWTIFSLPWTDAPALIRIEVQIPVNTESPPSSDAQRDE